MISARLLLTLAILGGIVIAAALLSNWIGV
jgi:hypothetical protein